MGFIINSMTTTTAHDQQQHKWPPPATTAPQHIDWVLSSQFVLDSLTGQTSNSFWVHYCCIKLINKKIVSNDIRVLQTLNNMADIRTQERILTCSEIKFLTPPVSPGLERSKLKTFTPPLTPTFRRRKSKSNIDLSFKSNRKENVSVFPYLEKEKKDWLLAAASNNVRIENNTDPNICISN